MVPVGNMKSGAFYFWLQEVELGNQRKTCEGSFEIELIIRGDRSEAKRFFDLIAHFWGFIGVWLQGLSCYTLCRSTVLQIV